MRDKIELRDYLTRNAASVDGLSERDRVAAIEAILRCVDSVPVMSGASPLGGQPSDRENLGFGIHSEKIGTVSIKGRNFFISWKKLLWSGASLQLANMMDMLSATSLLSFLAGGTVHIFDPRDAEILMIIHNNTNLLPCVTGEFYRLIADQLPATVNRAAFDHLLGRLSDCGAISLDNDVLAITETFIRLG